ncbi:hypothetical protein [Desulfatirhabdium butyrativorans]|uniref:hypothetical protein n=1 Tax=Desulfatirhabdium butyrativorans TaxID=340467 RepID=UPI0012EB6BB4|nr:hypothetical protein [Desulfatirhabdium butyrativorans]
MAPKQNDRRVSHPSVVCKKEEKDEELLGCKRNMQCMCQVSDQETNIFKSLSYQSVLAISVYSCSVEFPDGFIILNLPKRDTPKES